MNENLKKKLIEYTAENAFVQACGIEIWELEEDHAVMGTAARPELLNPMGMLHGGLLFTLADCCRADRKQFYRSIPPRPDRWPHLCDPNRQPELLPEHPRGSGLRGGQSAAPGPHRVHRAGGNLRERNAETAGSGNILHVCNAELNEQMLDRGKLESILREWLK